MYNKIENLIYDFIRDNEIATEEEISLVTNICGYNEKALNDIIWCRTAYHDAKQCYECEPENFYLSDELKDYYGLNEEEEEEEDNEE